MKLDRLIGILTVLLRRDKTTAPELGERTENIGLPTIELNLPIPWETK
jgi:hypothetical protein